MNSPKKILLVHLYSNGDCLYATTVARQIKEDYRGCHLTWAIASFCKNIIAHNPYVDEVMEITSVAKNDTAAFRRLKKELNKRKQQGEFDEVFITHNKDTNQALYDGSTRSNIFRAYNNRITVPVTPTLRLTGSEINSAKVFASAHRLDTYKHVILFEYAPQSGQSKITMDFAVTVAEVLVKKGDTAVILSSGNKIDHPNKAIIDGSVLTLRETGALTHYCSFLIGCSSGITWVSTSDAAKLLPMLQLLNADAVWMNPVSRDFERFHLPVEDVIEMIEFDEEKTISCINAALENFNDARKKFNQNIPLGFKTTRNIVYNLLVYFEFGAIIKHIKVNREVYGDNLSFYKEVIMGFLIFPFRLTKNLLKKKKR